MTRPQRAAFVPDQRCKPIEAGAPHLVRQRSAQQVAAGADYYTRRDQLQRLSYHATLDPAATPA
jgi:hypothetical protein